MFLDQVVWAFLLVSTGFVFWRVGTGLYPTLLVGTFPVFMWLAKEQYKAVPSGDGLFLPIEGEWPYSLGVALTMWVFHVSFHKILKDHAEKSRGA